MNHPFLIVSEEEEWKNEIKNTIINIALHLWRFKTPILMKIKNLFFIFF